MRFLIISITIISINANHNLSTLKLSSSTSSSRLKLFNQNNINHVFSTRSHSSLKSKLKLIKIHTMDQSTATSQMTTMYDYELNQSDRDASLNSSEEDLIMYESLIYVYTSVKFWRDFYIIFGTLFTITGFILNSLCIIIFYKSKLFRNSSFPYYVYVISIVDTLNIFFRFLVPQSVEFYVRNKLVNDYHVINYRQDEYDIYTSQIASDYLCSVLTYFHNSLTLVSVWLMVAVSVERWLVIKFALQTKYMIKLRAFFILFIVFIVIFSFNLFDLSPGLYIKPQWYSNLTLFCERQDIYNDVNNLTDLYKKLGPFTFNTETFALVRTIFQSILPFLVVLLFNSLIIYNFKKIKLAALGAGRGKSNSCVSVMSGGSNLIFSNNSSTVHKCRSGFKSPNRRFSSNSKTNHDDNKKTTDYCGENYELSKHNKAPSSSIIFANNNSSSRSPSPLPLHHQKSSTPTSLVSALNLADPECIKKDNILSSVAKTVPTTPTNEIEDNKTNNKPNNNKNLSVNNKQCASSSFLMPPTFSSSQRCSSDRHSIMMNDSTTPSIGTTNSSANLSVATTSNLTTTTMLNANTNHLQTHLSLKNHHGHHHHEKNRSNSIASCIESGKFSLLITNLTPNKKTVSTMTTIATSSYNNHNLSSKMSFKSRSSSRFKLNRETDIMLIVLSFSILLSQLPFTILWYLIYYYDILQEIGSSYTKANSPKFFYIIRVAEMCYFSLNFIFYITLSPSLRKELCSYSFKKNLIQFFRKYILKRDFCDKKDLIGIKKINNKLNNTINNNHNDEKNLRTPSMTRHNEFLVNNLTNSYDGRINAKKCNDNSRLQVRENKRMYSNSSGEYVDYLDKLRSISPIRRPTSFKYFEKENTPVIHVTQHDNNNSHHYLDNNKNNHKNNKKLFNKNFLIKKLIKRKTWKDKNTNASSSDPSILNKNNARQLSNIKIVIDNLYDEEEKKELKIDTDLLNDNQSDTKVGFHLSNSNGNNLNNLNDSSDKNNSDLSITVFSNANNHSNKSHLNNDKKLFNMSSPAFLALDHTFKSNNQNEMTSK
jgi:hypothetical protein